MSKTTRKEPPKIIQKIFDILENDGTKSTNEIATLINSNTQTVKRWVETIKLIQSKPTLIVEYLTLASARITRVRVGKVEAVVNPYSIPPPTFDTTPLDSRKKPGDDPKK